MSQFRHLQLLGGVDAVPYTSRNQGRNPVFESPARDRVPHAQRLKTEIRDAVTTAAAEQGAQAQASLGIQLTFESSPGYPLVTESLEDRTLGTRLLSVQRGPAGDRAVVFVPKAAIDKFIRKIDRYETETRKNGVPKNKTLIESIERARLAIAQDMWTDGRAFPTVDAPLWWEVWLRAETVTHQAAYDQFAQLARAAGLEIAGQRLAFPERVVTLVKARPGDWARARLLLENIAELRLPSEATTPYLELPARDQALHVQDVVQRLQPAGVFAPAVCVLDTGVMREHPLLRDSILEGDALAVRPEWQVTDHHEQQHGTGMAGNALFGCLTEIFQTTGPVELSHRLESVKVLPPRGRTEPELYGDTVAQAISRAEIAAPDRERVLCMAVTDTTLVLSDGEPTSWSSALDQLSWNDGQATRLMCVSAGNLREALSAGYAYTASNCDAGSCIEDPSQSWNALTVGAYTARATITLPDYQGWHPLAPAGGLCPASRTTVAWDDADRSDWPFKPDIVMEGGNWGTDPAGTVDRLVETSLLTTSMARTGRLLDINCETSGATALAARAAAIIKAAYPTLRWETIRALLVHSAEWTPQMLVDCPGEQRREVIRRLRMFGHGVPDIGRALWSLNNAVTLISEQQIQPYYLHDGKIRTQHMVMHSLPWPQQLLRDLGDAPVVLRATLSYFIEPSPGRRGWTNSFRYASHGLRFDVKRADETLEAFKARLSADVDVAEENAEQPGSDGGNWIVGKQARSRGSLHSDWWHGTAAELADRDALVVYPVTGWWRERKHLQRFDSVATYALVVSIATPGIDVDLYNEIATQIEVVSPIEV